MCDAIDECISNPCCSYDCVNTFGDLHCSCSNGYTGRQCQIPPNFCTECIQLRRSHGGIVQCNDTVDIFRCTISCEQGLYFAMPHLPVYECGLATGYLWNYQSDKNPTATLPSCSGTTDSVNTFVEHILDLDKIAQHIVNQSHDFFKVTLDGIEYNVNPGASGLGVISSMNCPKGSVRLDMVCTQCPVGTYSDRGVIILCPEGGYQDETEQTECKKCPPGHTTFGIGSVKLADCKNDYTIYGGKKETLKNESTIYVVHADSQGW
ncbi:hypothetical protein DPMN_165524 [Dreissena polymorpha]|uniref:EGF-like domain-containing protein n=1 Tax=Dreissena polymorpha TaxID=45954 RepID=A0A9D4IUN9_DREPO|nr:hypothetical protein DPMN_165524 [Dreissena polymorpha]